MIHWNPAYLVETTRERWRNTTVCQRAKTPVWSATGFLTKARLVSAHNSGYLLRVALRDAVDETLRVGFAQEANENDENYYLLRVARQDVLGPEEGVALTAELTRVYPV